MSQTSHEEDTELAIHQFIQYSYLKERRIACSNFIRPSSTGTHMILHKSLPNNIINILQNVCECWNVWYDLHVAENLSFMGECLVGPYTKRKDI